MTRVDLEQLLDPCSECGAPAGFEQGKRDGGDIFRARCSECCNIGSWTYGKYDSTVQWNIDQRKLDPSDESVCNRIGDEVLNRM